MNICHCLHVNHVHLMSVVICKNQKKDMLVDSFSSKDPAQVAKQLLLSSTITLPFCLCAVILSGPFLFIYLQ